MQVDIKSNPYLPKVSLFSCIVLILLAQVLMGCDQEDGISSITLHPSMVPVKVKINLMNGKITVGATGSLQTPLGAISLEHMLPLSQEKIDAVKRYLEVPDTRVLVVRVDGVAAIYKLEKGTHYTFEYVNDDFPYRRANLDIEPNGDIILELESVNYNPATSPTVSPTAQPAAQATALPPTPFPSPLPTRTASPQKWEMTVEPINNNGMPLIQICMPRDDILVTIEATHVLVWQIMSGTKDEFCPYGLELDQFSARHKADYTIKFLNQEHKVSIDGESLYRITFTETATGNHSAANPAAAVQPPVSGCTLIELPESQSAFNLISFEWKCSDSLSEGQGYEVRVWRQGEQPSGVHDSIADNQNGRIQHLDGSRYRLEADITDAPGVKRQSGTYFWTVHLVKIAPNYEDLGPLAPESSFQFNSD